MRGAISPSGFWSLRGRTSFGDQPSKNPMNLMWSSWVEDLGFGLLEGLGWVYLMFLGILSSSQGVDYRRVLLFEWVLSSADV